jgi:hypothetical protein
MRIGSPSVQPKASVGEGLVFYEHNIGRGPRELHIVRQAQRTHQGYCAFGGRVAIASTDATPWSYGLRKIACSFLSSEDMKCVLHCLGCVANSDRLG